MNNQIRSFSLALLFCLLFLHVFLDSSAAQAQAQKDSSSSASSSESAAAELGVSFVAGSNSKIILERNGKRYVIDAATHTVSETSDKAAADDSPEVASSSLDKPQTQPQAQAQLSDAASDADAGCGGTAQGLRTGR
jgi:hypothetical protein